jgi:HK97 gp10 family phage protein
VDGIYLCYRYRGFGLMKFTGNEFQVRIDGVDDLNRKFKRLSRPLKQRSLQRAVLTGARVIRDEARLKAPRGETGNLKTQIKARLKKTKKFSVAAAISWTKAGGPFPGFYGLFIEKGTKRRQRKRWRKQPMRKPANTGAMTTSQAFLEPAYDAKKGLAAEILKLELWKLVQQRVKGRG